MKYSQHYIIYLLPVTCSPALLSEWMNESLLFTMVWHGPWLWSRLREAHAPVANRLIDSARTVDNGHQALAGQAVGVCVWDLRRLYRTRVSMFVVNMLCHCRTFFVLVLSYKRQVSYWTAVVYINAIQRTHVLSQAASVLHFLCLLNVLSLYATSTIR